MMQMVEDRTWKAKVVDNELPVLAFMTAVWCPQCRAMTPFVQELAKRDDLDVVRVQIEDNEDLQRQFKVMAVPTFVVMRGGEAVAQRSGLQSKADFIAWVDEALAG